MLFTRINIYKHQNPRIVTVTIKPCFQLSQHTITNNPKNFSVHDNQRSSLFSIATLAPPFQKTRPRVLINPNHLISFKIV